MAVAATKESGAHCLDVTLREGSTGGYVASLQAALKRRGYNLGTTGPRTRYASRRRSAFGLA